MIVRLSAADIEKLINILKGPKPMDRLKQLVKSRKFWAAIVALALALFGHRAGLTAEMLQNAIYTLIAFIIGTGLENIADSR